MVREVVPPPEGDDMMSNRSWRGDSREGLWMLITWIVSMMTMMMSCLGSRGIGAVIEPQIEDHREILPEEVLELKIQVKKELLIEDMKEVKKEKDLL